MSSTALLDLLILNAIYGGSKLDVTLLIRNNTNSRIEFSAIVQIKDTDKVTLKILERNLTLRAKETIEELFTDTIIGQNELVIEAFTMSRSKTEFLSPFASTKVKNILLTEVPSITLPPESFLPPSSQTFETPPLELPSPLIGRNIEAEDVLEFTKAQLDGALKFISSIPNILNQAGIQIANDIDSNVRTFINNFSKTLDEGLTSIDTTLNSIREGVESDLSEIDNSLFDVQNEITNFIENSFDEMSSDLNSFTTILNESISSFSSDIINSLASLTNTLNDNITNMLNSLSSNFDSLLNVFSNSLNSIESSLNTISVNFQNTINTLFDDLTQSLDDLFILIQEKLIISVSEISKTITRLIEPTPEDITKMIQSFNNSIPLIISNMKNFNVQG